MVDVSAKMCSMKYFILLSVAVFTSLNADLLMEVKPAKITVGLTKTLSVTCSYNHTQVSNMEHLVSLVLMRSNGTDHARYNLAASVDVFGGVTNITGDVSGQIDNGHESYLKLTWNNPKSDLAGFYICEANGQNLHGQPVSISKIAQVDAIRADVDDLLQIIQQQSSFLDRQSSLLELQSSKLDSQTTDLLKLQEDLRRLSLSVNDKCICCDRFNKSLQAFYRISDVHNGRRYYLSPASRVLVVKEAERQCELMGGYLTEMDSEDEYLFVKNFLKNFADIEYLFIGGSDEKVENNWVNIYSGTPVKYILWNPGEPSAGRRDNCLIIWGAQDWRMADNMCNEGDVQTTVGYLCEVPEIK